VNAPNINAENTERIIFFIFIISPYVSLFR